MARNAMADAEAQRTQKMIEAFKTLHPTFDVEKMTEEQLVVFDAFTEEWDANIAEQKAKDAKRTGPLLVVREEGRTMTYAVADVSQESIDASTLCRHEIPRRDCLSARCK